VRTEFHLDVAGVTRKGASVIRQNDDRLLVYKDNGLLVVADASGPTYGGYHAPRGVDVGLAAIVGGLEPSRHGHECDAECERSAFLAAARAMHALDVYGIGVSRRPPLAHFWASVTSLRFAGARAVAAQIGTCRAYRWRRGAIELLLPDHSLEGMLRAQGQSAEASVHRGVALLMLGADPLRSADVRTADVEPGDRYVVCTDGVWGALDDASLARACAPGDAMAVASRLDALAAEAAPSNDDATVAVAIVARSYGATIDVPLVASSENIPPCTGRAWNAICWPALVS
jgi:protein phosphatase